MSSSPAAAVDVGMNGNDHTDGGGYTHDVHTDELRHGNGGDEQQQSASTQQTQQQDEQKDATVAQSQQHDDTRHTDTNTMVDRDHPSHEDARSQTNGSEYEEGEADRFPPNETNASTSGGDSNALTVTSATPVDFGGRVYVGQLPRGTTDSDLRDVFKESPSPIEKIFIKTGYAFIHFTPSESLNAWLRTYQAELRGSRLKIEFSKLGGVACQKCGREGHKASVCRQNLQQKDKRQLDRPTRRQPNNGQPQGFARQAPPFNNDPQHEREREIMMRDREREAAARLQARAASKPLDATSPPPPSSSFRNDPRGPRDRSPPPPMRNRSRSRSPRGDGRFDRDYPRGGPPPVDPYYARGNGRGPPGPPFDRPYDRDAYQPPPRDRSRERERYPPPAGGMPPHDRYMDRERDRYPPPRDDYPPPSHTQQGPPSRRPRSPSPPPQQRRDRSLSPPPRRGDERDWERGLERTGDAYERRSAYPPSGYPSSSSSSYPDPRDRDPAAAAQAAAYATLYAQYYAAAAAAARPDYAAAGYGAYADAATAAAAAYPPPSSRGSYPPYY